MLLVTGRFDRVSLLHRDRHDSALRRYAGFRFLFRWFLGIALDEPMWDHSSFTQIQQRLIGSEVTALFFDRILDQDRRKKLLSAEHFTVDGTLLEPWASLKSFKPRDGAPPASEGRNPEVDFKGQKRCNKTHASTTDPHAKLMRKSPGKESKLGWPGNVLMENRSGLVVASLVKEATGTAEQEAAEEMLRAMGKRYCTVGADKGYDVKAFIEALREMNVTPHIARKDTSNLDGRTTRHPGYAVSQRIRKCIEEIFGWIKTIGLVRKLRYIGEEKFA